MTEAVLVYDKPDYMDAAVTWEQAMTDTLMAAVLNHQRSELKTLVDALASSIKAHIPDFDDEALKSRREMISTALKATTAAHSTLQGFPTLNIYNSGVMEVSMLPFSIYPNVELRFHIDHGVVSDVSGTSVGRSTAIRGRLAESVLKCFENWGTLLGAQDKSVEGVIRKDLATAGFIGDNIDLSISRVPALGKGFHAIKIMYSEPPEELGYSCSCIIQERKTDPPSGS